MASGFLKSQQTAPCKRGHLQPRALCPGAPKGPAVADPPGKDGPGLSVRAELLWKADLRPTFLGGRNPDLPFTPTWFSVHRLKPSDIKVIAALGDSLTVSDPDCGGNGEEQEGPGLGSWGDWERKPHPWLSSVAISGPDRQSLFIPVLPGARRSLPIWFSPYTLHSPFILLPTLG